MVQASNPFEQRQQEQLAQVANDEPMSENCIKARKWLADQFQPFVCVFSTKNVQKRMQEVNGLTPAEFLRPFGEVGNLSNYLVRSCDRNTPYKLNRFKVNFIDNHLMSEHPKPSDRIPERIINDLKPKVRSEMATLASFSTHNSKRAINATLSNLIGANRQATEREQTPWFTQMKKHLYQTNRFAQHELTQQPVAFFFFLSVEDKDPLTNIDRMRSTEMLPKQYRTGVYDNSKQTIKQFVLILNDQPDAQSSFSAIKSKVASQFSETAIHEIRMSASAQSQPLQDMWQPYLDLDLRMFDKTASKIKVCGTSFSTNDRTQTHQIVRKIIEKIVPFSVQRIKSIEQNIAKTRKGFSKFIRIFRSSERGENDGAQPNFRMNRSELELRTLIDLAFVIQDYETTFTNAEIPSSDFKRIKAHLHAAHCDEIRLYARIAHERFYSQNNIRDLVQTANAIYDSYHMGSKVHQNSSQSMIRFTLMMTELLQLFGQHDQAANFFVRLANRLADKAILRAMCFEQAAYEYLMLQQFRKFGYYMTLAGQAYEKMGQKDLKSYSFNCFTLVHPFYQARSGWNTIHFQLYSMLGANSDFADGNSQLAVQFFRNLLLLTHQFNDVTQQRHCLMASLQAFRKFQQDADDEDSAVALGSHIGYLELPQILPHTIEVFVDHEKVLTNLKENKIPCMPGGSYQANQGECNLIDQQFINFNGFYRDRGAVESAQKEASSAGSQIENEDINQSNIPWRILEKQITDYMRKNHMEELKESNSESIYQISGDEMTECSIYDATCLKDRTDTTFKRQRKVFQDTEVRVRFILRNPLLTDISLSNLRLRCRYVNPEAASGEAAAAPDEYEEAKTEELKADSVEMQLSSREQVEVILKVVPKKPGTLVIEQICWELYDIFKCEYDLISGVDKNGSRVRPEYRSALPRQLLEIEKIFSLQVLPPSAELSASIELDKNGNLPRLGQHSRLVFSETDSGKVKVKNLSRNHTIKNIFMLCSHPLIFDIFSTKLTNQETGSSIELKPGEEVRIPINFRAAIRGEFSVRFLFRYEVKLANAIEKVPATCRFRFQRMIMFVNSQCLFQMLPVVHMSVREANKFVVNLMTQQRLSTSWYERPQVSSIEAINGARHWSLAKKDTYGNFFTVSPRQQGLNDSIDEIPGAQLGYLRQSVFVGDLLEGLDGEKTIDYDSLTKDKVAFTFFERESNNMENTSKKWRKTEGEAEKEQIDLVVRWRMPEIGKSGFITLFGVQLLKEKKQLTNLANKIQEAQTHATKSIRLTDSVRRTASQSRRAALSEQKIVPIRVTCNYQQHITHHFTDRSPSKMIELTLNIQNILQELPEMTPVSFSCQVIASQQWQRGSQGRYRMVDVSDGESFLWVGKTTHKLQCFKPNETKKVVLRAMLPRQGIFNLNRFNILIKQLNCPIDQSELLQNEYRIRDALVVEVNDPKSSEKEDHDDLLLKLTEDHPQYTIDIGIGK